MDVEEDDPRITAIGDLHYTLITERKAKILAEARAHVEQIDHAEQVAGPGNYVNEEVRAAKLARRS